MSSAVETIKEKLSVAEVIGSYVKLERTGINFKAKCPFHNEKTPSFFISPSRGSYYCFGCGEKGDIFSFVEHFEGVDFKGALKILAEKAGISLEAFSQNTAEDREKSKLYEILEKAMEYFAQELSKNPKALEYIQGRGLTKKSIENWKIGYAPDEWRELKAYLTSKGYKDEDMLKAGLIKKSDKGSYDVFRSRIIFPIFDISGRVIAFSGRIYAVSPKEGDNSQPKYLNSPDTFLFKKSDVLYGLHKAKVAIRKKNYSILVEGQMDLLMCHQAGFGNAVATSGTALTQKHIERLSSLSHKILMIFDGDEAGFNASGRAASLAMSLGMEVKLGILPQGLDPADLIQKDIVRWKKVVSESKHIIDFQLEHIMQEQLPPRKTIEEVQGRILPLIQGLASELEKAHFIGKVRDMFNLSEEALWQDLKKVSVVKKEEEGTLKHSLPPPQDTISPLHSLIGVLFSEKARGSGYVEKIEVFLKKIVGDEGYEDVFKEIEGIKDRVLFEAEKLFPQGLDEESFLDLIQRIGDIFIKKELEKLTHAIRKAESSGDGGTAQKLLIEYNNLIKKTS